MGVVSRVTRSPPRVDLLDPLQASAMKMDSLSATLNAVGGADAGLNSTGYHFPRDNPLI